MSIRSQRGRRPLLLVLAAALPMAACDVIDAPIDPVSGAPMLYPEGMEREISVKSSSLQQVGGCQDIDGLLRSVLVTEMMATVQASFASALSSREHCRHFWQGLASEDTAMPSASSPSGTQTKARDYSETNNQVAGVDEADLVKTDGSYLYQVGRGALHIVRAWPAAQTQLVSRFPLEGTPKKLFVKDNRVLVYSSLDGGVQDSDQSYSPRYYADGECTYGYDCVPTGDGHPTQITVLDVTDRSAPQLVRELTLSSSLLAARRVGGAVHTVVTLPLQRPRYQTWPEGLDICDSSRVDIYETFRALLLDNLAQLKAAKLERTVPTVEDRVYTAAGVALNPSPLDQCRGFLRPSLADGGQITSLLSLSIDDEQPARAVSIVSRPGVVYATQSALYLAEPRNHSYWGWFVGIEENQATTVHKLELPTGQAAPRYLASGLVRGRLLNQFSLDEQAGYLRLASTTRLAGQGNAGLRNLLTVLEQQGTQLAPVGIAPDIAPGEDIRSVRFDGDRGYVVTFKKTDPLFVLDLADARRPRVLGELVIPGFSTYLHRLDAGHLLSIGYGGNDVGSFAWFTSVALQIFDVTSPTQPRLMWKHEIGTRGSSSEALTDHLAFTFHQNLLALPISICDGGSQYGGYADTMSFSGLMLFDVSAAKGFQLRGRMDFPASSALSCSNWWTQGSSAVKRSIVIEGFVYAVSDDLLRVAEVSAPQNVLVSLPLN